MNLIKFYKQLESLDWTHMMSDSLEVHQRGIAAQNKVRAISEKSDRHKELYEQYYKYIWSGRHMGTKQQPKPVKPLVDEAFEDNGQCPWCDQFAQGCTC